MVTEQAVYWATRLDSIKGLLTFWNIGGILLLGVLGFFTCIYCVEEREKPAKAWWRFLITLCVVAVLSGTANAFVPSTKEYAAIKVLPMVINSPQAAEAASRVGTLSSSLLDLATEWVNELRPNTGTTDVRDDEAR